MRIIIPILALVLFLPCLAASASDEAYGRVIKVVDGDTIDIALQDYNSSQIAEDVIRIRLADIDTPEVRGPKACEAGKKASAYTRAWLLSNYIFLDLDDKTGTDGWPWSIWLRMGSQAETSISSLWTQATR